jgi:hypothetical protein
MELYTREMFEKELIKNKNRIIVRNGESVGLYRYLPKENKLILTKSIDGHSFDLIDQLKVYKSGEYWGSGGTNGISALVPNCNEAHLIPKGYDLRKKENLRTLNKCLGGCYSDVEKRINKNKPNN